MIVADYKYEERDTKCNSNNVTMDTFIRSPVTTNIPREKTDVLNVRRILSGSLTETLRGFNILTLQSTINYSADAESDPKSNQVVATHTSDREKIKVTATDTTKGNSSHKLLANRKSQRSSKPSYRRLTKRPRTGL